MKKKRCIGIFLAKRPFYDGKETLTNAIFYLIKATALTDHYRKNAASYNISKLIFCIDRNKQAEQSNAKQPGKHDIETKVANDVSAYKCTNSNGNVVKTCPQAPVEGCVIFWHALMVERI